MHHQSANFQDPAGATHKCTPVLSLLSAVSLGFISTSSTDVNGILALSGVMLPAQILYTGSTCLQPCSPPQEEQMQMVASLAAA